MSNARQLWRPVALGVAAVLITGCAPMRAPEHMFTRLGETGHLEFKLAQPLMLTTANEAIVIESGISETSTESDGRPPVRHLALFGRVGHAKGDYQRLGLETMSRLSLETDAEGNERFRVDFGPGSYLAIYQPKVVACRDNPLVPTSAGVDQCNLIKKVDALVSSLGKEADGWHGGRTVVFSKRFDWHDLKLLLRKAPKSLELRSGEAASLEVERLKVLGAENRKLR